MRKIYRVSTCLAAIAGVTVSIDISAVAQTSGQTNPESISHEEGADIVVTARRREERLQDVPISIAAYNSAEIEKKSLTDIQNVAQATPNITYAAGYTRGKSAGNLVIRGVGQTNTDTQFEPGVGIYLDGVYIASMQGVNLNLLDVDRVEVLRGPQGTLFGRNTIGGAMNIVSKMPDDEWGGKVELGVGSRGRMDVKAQANIPFIPGSIEARIGFSTEQADGFGHVLDYASGSKIGDTGNKSRIAGRALVQFTFSDTLKALFSIDGRRVRETNTAFDIVGIQPADFRTLLNSYLTANNLPLYDEKFLTPGRYDTYGTGPNFYEIDSYNMSGTLTWDVSDSLTFKSITAYRNLKAASGVDFDGSPYQLIEQDIDWDQEQFSQEFQLNGSSDKLNWVIGLFYMDFDATDFRYNNFGGEVFLFGGPDRRSESKTVANMKSYAIFGQATYALTDSLNFTLGGRYSHDKRHFEGASFPVGATPPNFAGGTGKWNAFSGTAAIDYKINRDLMIYASIGRGYKGGIPPNPDILPVQDKVAPEYITTYEVGFKSEFLDRKLRWNTALFYSDYKDVQLQVPRINPVTLRPANVIINAAKLRLQGLETELVAYPAPSMTLSASYGYVDAKYKDFEATVPFPQSNEAVETPKHTVALSGEYSMTLTDSLNLVPRLDWSYKSGLFHDIFNAPLGYQKGYGILNGRISLESDDNKWAVSLSVTNITNRWYTVGSQNTTGPGFGMENRLYGDPREWRLSGRFSF